MILVHEPLAVLAVLLVITLGKSLVAFGIVLAAGYPASTAVLISASLAQIGEFSFILAGLGVALGLLPPEGRDLILAGALLSITLNPLVFLACSGISSWLSRKPELLKRLESRNAQPPATRPDVVDENLRDHAIIVGYGRVGDIIGNGLRSRGFSVVAIDQDRRRVEALRKRGIYAVYGDATTPGVLNAAGAGKARLIIIATAEGYQTRRILELARELQPQIDTAVRTQSEAEVAHLEQMGVGIAIMGERELAFGLMDYGLRRLGVPRDEARQIVQAIRLKGEGGVYERRPSASFRGAPELRPHREDADHEG
jgi:CPA2 family monovalent cation:H+ antiporter-2